VIDPFISRKILPGAGRGKIKQSKRKEAKNDEKDDRDKQYLKNCSAAPGKGSFFERRHLV